MSEISRYALYYAPPKESALAAFGAAWLGWDIETGAPVPHPRVAELPRPLADITETPRKYGFHGTLKPPFRLAEGARADGLSDALKRFGARTPAFEAPPLRAASLGSFLALVPAETEGPAADALSAFAARVVEAFEPFRAPLTEAELARRRKGGLTERQEGLLSAWGYPYVMEEFRFHLTLSGRLAEAEAAAVRAAAAPHLEPILGDPMPVRELCLFGEMAESGRFRVLERVALTG